MVNKIFWQPFDDAKFNNRLAFLFSGIALFILFFSLVNYSVRRHFLLEKIIITGDIMHVTPEQLSYVAQNKLHGTLFTLDIDGLKREFKQIPWVKQVSLARSFPDSIVVNIVEYHALARLGEYSLISPNGDVFEGAESNPNLPTFYVDNSQISLAIEYYNKINAVLAKHNQSIAKMWLSLPATVKIATFDGVTIVICNLNFSQRLATLDRYWASLQKLNPDLNSINLCYKNAVAINTPNKSVTKTDGGNKNE